MTNLYFKYGSITSIGEYHDTHTYHLMRELTPIHIDAVRVFGDDAKRTMDAMIENYDVMTTATSPVEQAFSDMSRYEQDMNAVHDEWNSEEDDNCRENETVDIGQACVDAIAEVTMWQYKSKHYKTHTDAEHAAIIDRLHSGLHNCLPKDNIYTSEDDIVDFLLTYRVEIDKLYSLEDKMKGGKNETT